MALGFTRGGFMAAAAAALLVLSAAPGQAGGAHRHAMQGPGGAAAHGVARAGGGGRKLAVLYDQTGNPSGIGTVSADFGDAFTSAAADDFTVPKKKSWTIKEVDVPGAYFNGSGPADSVDVVIYRDKKHKPGKVLAQFRGFGSGCTAWTVESECVPTKLGDHMFVLKGKAR